jgi:hypothetical protein
MKKLFLILTILLLTTTISMAAMSQLKTVKELPSGYPLVGITPATYIDTMVLAADIPEVYTIPSGAVNVLINCTSDVWVKFGGAGAVPTTEVIDGTASELNPALRTVVKTDGTKYTTIGFSSAAANKCSICIWNK